MVETNVKRADKTLNKGEATLDPSRKEVMYKTTGGTTIGVGHDAHHDDTGVVQMAKTIGKGEMPSNVQLENTIEKAKVSLDQTSPTLTAHGRKLAEDAKEVLESAEQLLENKNPDESLQRIVKEANLLSREGVEQGAEQAKEMYNDQYDSTGLMRSTIQNVRDLVVFLLRSSDFRGFMLDSLELFQSILRDIDRKHGDSLMEGIKKDANREDTRMNETKRAGESLKEDIKQGNLGDEEKKESLEDRFESLLFKISENPQYHQAINNIFALVDQLQARFEKFEPSTQLGRNDRSSLIIDESWNILSKFVDERDLVLYRDFFWELFNELKYDMEARQFFWDLKQYMLKLATNPDEITDNYRKEQAKDFVNRAKALFRSGQYKYQDRFNRLFELTFTILNQIRNDADTQQFVDSLGQLAKDFFTDDQGKPDLFVTQESIQQLRDMIIPILEKQLENVPLPMIEGTNDKYDWKLEDITLYGKDLLPDTFDLKMTNNLVLGHKHTDDKYVSKLKVSGKKIKLALNDFKFWYHRKTVPKLEDSGIADLKMLGNGLSFKLVWKLWITENKPLTIKLDSIKVWIDKLDIDIKKSNHSFINKLATKLFAGTIKRKVGDAIVEQMRSNIDPLNDQLNSFFRRERDNRRMMSTANEKLKEVYDANIGGKLKETAENIKEKLTPDRGVESEEKKEFSSGGTGVEHYEFSSGGTFEKSTILKDTSAVSGRYANVSKDTPLEKETIIKEETFSTENPFEAQEGKYHGQWKAKLPK